MTRAPLLGAVVSALAVAALLGAGRLPARADPPKPAAAPVPVLVAVPDPSPLTGAAPRNAGVDAAVHTLDAAQQAAAARAFAAQAADAAKSDEPEPAQPTGGGRAGLRTEPSVGTALAQLQRIDTRTTGVQLEPRLEIAHTIAQEAWGWMIEQSNQVVITQRRPEPDYFSGRFKPRSVDDLPPVLAIQVHKSHVVVPSPVSSTSSLSSPWAAPSTGPSSWIPKDFLPKGVLMGFDEAAIRGALAAGSAPSPAAADAAEAALLAAGDDPGAVVPAQTWIPPRAVTEVRDVAVRSVSLRRALDAPARPGEPRPFGGITRIVGVVLEADGDVRVLGREEAGAPALLLDDVVVALSTVWRDGLTPGCSLDPDPLDTGGPQHVRVLSVPRDSAFAKTMLEADYAMKKVLCGTDDVGVEGVQSLPDLMIEAHEPAAELRNRFWLCAVPAKPGDLVLSDDRRSLLLTATVETRTERMLLGEHGEHGTGTTSDAAEVAARAFSARFDAVAAARPVFRRLQGLFDLTLLARALRVLAPDHPLLARACAVAREPVAVPPSYPGISTTRVTASGWLVISGGCEVGTSFERRTLRRLGDDDARRLAAAAGSDTATIRIPREQGAGPAGGDALAAATMALVRGDAAGAIGETDAVLDRDPANARARSLRAEAFRAAGRPSAALREAAAAAALEPDDVAYAALLRRLRMDEEGAAALEGAPAAVRAEVVRLEVTAAASALAEADAAGALAAASRALLADPRSFEASLVAASAAWLAGSLDEADAHTARALEVRPAAPEPRVMRATLLLSRRRGPAALPDLDAAAAAAPESDTLALRAFARLVSGDVPGAVDDAGRAIAASPRSDLAGAAVAAVAMAAHAPLATVETYVADLFALPPRAMTAIGSAYAAAQAGRVVDATAGYEQALAVLDAAGRPPDSARTRIEISLVGLLPAAAVASGRSPEIVRDRVEALTATLEARGDAPVSTQFARAVAERSFGDNAAAIARIDKACEALSRPDVVQAEFFPGKGDSVEALLRTIEATLLMSKPEELLHGPRIVEILGRFPALLGGGPGVPAAQGLLEYVTALRADPAGDSFPPELRAAMSKRAEEVRAGFASGKPTLADAVVAAFFLSIASQTEAGMGDVAAAEAQARVLWGLATPDEMSPYAKLLIPMLRVQTATKLLDRWMRDADRDPELALPDAGDPAALERLQRALDVRAKRADDLGEPAFALLFHARIGRLVSDARDKSAKERVRRIERVRDVAAPGPKRDRLEADLAAARRAITAAESGRGDAIRERVAKAYAASRTLTQMYTLDKAVAQIAADAGPDAPHWAVPQSAGLEALTRALAQARERAKAGR